MHTLTAPWRAQCLYATVELAIPDLIDKGFTTDDSLSKKTGVPVDKIKRLMRFLVASGTFQLGAGQQYENTECSMLLMRESGAAYDTALLYGREIYRCWGHFHTSLVTSQTGFMLEYGQEFYPYLHNHSDTSLRFQRTLRSRKALFEKIPTLLDLKDKTIVDIGGGHGELTRVVLESVSSAKSIVLDLAEGLSVANSTLADFIQAKRATLKQGSMFDRLPENGDIYLLSRIIGDLEDRDTIRLLRNCKIMMGKRSKIAIIEQIVDGCNPSELSALWDLHLMMVCNGCQRTLEELEKLINASDLYLERVVPLSLGMSLLIASQAS